MDRRGFLARLTAAATAMVAAAQSGGIVVADEAAKRQRVGELVRDNVLKPHRRLSDAQQQLIELLRECKPIECGVSHYIDGRPPKYSITYRQRAAAGIVEADEPLPYCNRTHQQILDTGSPVSMEVWMEANNLDVVFPYAIPPREETFRIEKPEAYAKVEWYLP